MSLSGEHRALIGAAETGPGGELRVEVDERPDEVPTDKRTRELEREYRATVEEILELRGDDGRIAAFLRAIAEPGALADSAGYSPTLSYEQKVELLRTLDVTDRLELAVKLQRESLAELQVRRRIREDVQEGAEKQQREYFLRKQMESIRKELGEDDASVADEYRTKIDEADMPEPVKEQALKELARLERMGEQTGESSMIRTYLDWLIAVPWGKRSEERLDPVAAREVLDADHAGLEDVKDRVTEYLAVRKLRQERGIEADPKSGAILTLIGPPGTGKTSIGESIARATGREFVRMSLGGVRDEAEIRGHRRTYIGALPGRLVRALRDAGTMNPVILLDEVDKVGADWRGDPSAALLEVLDPAQNHSFRDHYLDVELDLCQVMFLATANVADTIPGPLLDRMEVIRFDGYTSEEKLAIAKGYLWPRQRDRNGLREDEVSISDEVLRTIISEYTREAGVRNLERELGKVLRKTATRIASSLPAQPAAGEGEAASENGATSSPEGEPAKPAKTSKATSSPKGESTIELPVSIDLEVVRDALGRQKFFQESAARTATPGVATGLAVTGTGGDVLFVEATAMKGGGSGGNGLVLTGQLGDVMKESARIALSYVRGHAEELGIEPRGVREPRVPRARPRRRDPQGRPERRRDDGDGARVAAVRSPGQAHRGHDRRGHAAGSRAADRRAQAEGARRARGRPDRRDPAGAQPRRPRRHPRGGPRADDLPPGDDRPGGPRPRTGARPRCRARVASEHRRWRARADASPSPWRSALPRTSSSGAGSSRSSTRRSPARCASASSPTPSPASPRGCSPSACANSRPPG